jgi:hypothetical protein
MKPALKMLIAAITLLPAIPALAMHDGDKMMNHKMSAKQMQQLGACKAMPHDKAMKSARCTKLMKAEEMSMHHGAMEDGAMHDRKM